MDMEDLVADLRSRTWAPGYSAYRLACLDSADAEPEWQTHSCAALGASVAAATVIRLEGLLGDNWVPVRHAQRALDDSMVQCFFPSVPCFSFPIPPAWHAREAEFWREAHASGEFGLDIAMAAHIHLKLLEQNKYVRDARFRSWPSRDRHQFWATLWLAMRLVPDRLYSEAELECLIAMHLERPERSLMVAMQSELLRRDFVTRQATKQAAGPGASGDGTSDGSAHFVLCRRTLEFVFDGDKLFAVRTAVVARRPWWALPLAAQLVVAPPPSDQRPLATHFRCVLLAPDWQRTRQPPPSMRPSLR